MLEIDVSVDSNAPLGALSFVPKHARLPADAVYAGIPAIRLR